MEEKICRLCLNVVKNEYEIIDAVTRQMLEVLSLKIDLKASKNPMLCQDCAELTKRSYFFKSAYMDTEELIFSYASVKEKAKIDIKDVYEDSKGVVEDGFSVCRSCMNQIIASNCVSLDKLINDERYVEMLSTLMPEIILNIIKDPVICLSCLDNLECFFKFTQNCCDTEVKINKYRQNEGSCSTSQIKLSNVIGFLFKDVSIYPEKHTQMPIIKQESLFEDMEQNTDFQMHVEQIKCEETVDIKEEHVSLEEISCKSPSEIDNNLEIHKAYPLNYETKHKEREMYKCEICTFETKYKSHLKTHTLVHKASSEVEMYKCETCTYETKYKKNLKAHRLKHNDVSEVVTYKCEICTYETKYKKSLQFHILIHNDSCVMHKCGICTYETRYKSSLTRHMLVHKDNSEVKMHKCETCTYETKYIESLQNHIIIHKDSCVMHKCGICTYETRYKNSLKRHMLIHKDSSEVEMHKCEICTYETKRKYSFKQHVLTHEDTCEVYKCGICSYETKHKQPLQRHMLTHMDKTEIEMHKCGICSYETKYKKNIQTHRLKHKDSSEVEMHKCGMCTYETKYKRSLKRHLLIHKK